MANAEVSGYNGGKYSFEQQVFCLSWSTTLSFNITGPAPEIARQTKALLLKVLQDKDIRDLIGTWDLVWGPAVFADSFTGKKEALNTMFIVAPKSDPEQAVIAIAGTNGTSLMDWVVEDFNVKEKVPWPFSDSPKRGAISKGTSFGMDKLVKLESLDAKGKSTITAKQFLAGASYKNVMVTGHSLGGALSPCYSLYLDETRKQWDPSRSVTISCFPTAGATPGDSTFSKYYDDRLLSTTTRAWNTLDIVPRAFNKETLEPIPDLYQPHISSAVITRLVNWVIRSTEQNDYLNVSPQTEGFPSQYFSIDSFVGNHKALLDHLEQVAGTLQEFLLPFEKDAEEAIAFIVQALIQHTIGYIVHYDIGAFSERMSAVAKQEAAVVSEPAGVASRLKEAFTALGNSPILLDLGERPTAKIDELKRGEGPLLAAILDKVQSLNAGKPNAGAQTVIFLVEEESLYCLR